MQGNQKKLSDLCRAFEQALIENGYGEDCLKRYRKVLHELSEFSKDEEFYSQKVCADFLVEKLKNTGGFVPKGDYSKTQMYYLRTIRSLADFSNFGTIFRRKEIKGFILWPKSFREPMEKYLRDLFKNRHSQKYIRETELTIRDFILYLDAHSVFCFSNIKPEYVSGFVSSMVGYSPRTVARKISILRCLFRFLYLEEYITYPLSETLPKVFNCARTTLPTIWSSEDIEKILSTVDRGNPNGKRDYAIILMVAQLGLRIGDVRDLKLYDIDWHENIIKITQNKTGDSLSLPLLKDVGWTIIDYLKNGRPETDSPYVFLRHLAPFLPFSSNNNLHGMISKIISKARISTENKSRNGMHSLRHSLACNLMQNNVEVSTISDILGHSDPETVKHYLRVDIPALRQCALNVEVM